MKPALSEVRPAEARPLCPAGSGQLPGCPQVGVEEQGHPRGPHRSSLKPPSVSRQGSIAMDMHGLDPDTAHSSRRSSVHFE